MRKEMKMNSGKENQKKGFNPNEDRKVFTVTPRGIVVVPKGYFKGLGPSAEPRP